MYFCLYGLCVDAVVMNRVLPNQVRDQYFDAWRATQERNIEEATSYFAPVRLLKARLAEDEVLGPDSLKALAREVYGDEDPAKVLLKQKPYSFIKENGVYKVRVKLPFLTKEDVQLAQSGDELIIRIGNFKRHVILPRSMVGRSPSGAKLDGDVLIVSFADRKK
jgi:arsenite-transporting ATPase